MEELSINTSSRDVAGRARAYETIYILRPSTPKEESERVNAKVQEVVERFGGKTTAIYNWGSRQLAYSIQKHRHGVFVYNCFLGGGGLVAELERNLRMIDSVIRYQTVKVEEDVVLEGVEVDPSDVVFEAAEPFDEGDGDSIEDRLGFSRSRRDRDDRDRGPRIDAEAQPSEDKKASEEDAASDEAQATDAGAPGEQSKDEEAAS